MIAGDPVADSTVADATQLWCSAKSCTQPATVKMHWNNPKIHTPDRRKTWLACSDHAASLSEFLSLRGFLRETEPVETG